MNDPIDPAGDEERWPPEGCPPLACPELPDAAARHAWYAAVIGAYQVLWDGHASAPVLAPVANAAMDALAARLGCPLPASLRDYHRHFGALSLAEMLRGVEGRDPIEPLLQAFPGLTDIAGADNEPVLSIARELVAFGDSLGNGNHFCFHRQTGEVYFVDHDDGQLLTVFFAGVGAYLDALMVCCLAEIYNADDDGEALLAERLGTALVRKWKY